MSDDVGRTAAGLSDHVATLVGRLRLPPIPYADLPKEKQKIGESNSVVFKLSLKDRDLALKEFPPRIPLKNIFAEIKALQDINAPNVLAFERIVTESDSTGTHYVRGVLTEYCQKDLGKYIQELHAPETHSLPRFSFDVEKQLLFILRDVAHGLDAIHQHGFTHRDVKPTNILLKEQNGQFVAKVADFETSRDEWGSGITTMGKTRTTEAYMAVEVQLSNGRWSAKSDVWSFGLVAGQLFTNHAPMAPLLNGSSVGRFLAEWEFIHHCDVRKGPAAAYAAEYAGDSCKAIPDVLQSCVVEPCLQHEPDERPSCESVIQSLKKVQERLSHRLPDTRLFRVLYSKQRDFDAGIFAKDPANQSTSVRDHVANGSKKNSIPTRFVSTTTSFDWAVYYAAKQCTESGYIDNPFIVEIDPALLQRHLATKEAGGHVECFCLATKELAEINGVSDAMPNNFAADAQEVLFSSTDPDQPAIPRDSIVGCYQLPLQRSQTDPGRFAQGLGVVRISNKNVHVLDLKASARRESVCSGLYKCHKFEKFKDWFPVYHKAFLDPDRRPSLMEAMKIDAGNITARALEVSKATAPDFCPAVSDFERELGQITKRELQIATRARGMARVPARKRDLVPQLARLLWQEAVYWRGRWPRAGKAYPDGHEGTRLREELHRASADMKAELESKDAAVKAMQAKLADADRLRATVGKLREDLEHANSGSALMKAALERKDTDMKAVLESKDAAVKAMQAKLADVDRLRATVGKLREELEHANSGSALMKAALERKDTDMKAVLESKDAAVKAMQAKLADVDRLRATVGKLREDLEHANSGSALMKAALERKDTDMKAVLESKDAAVKAMQAKLADVDRLRATVRELREELEHAREASADVRAAAVERKDAAVKAMQGGSSCSSDTLASARPQTPPRKRLRVSMSASAGRPSGRGGNCAGNPGIIDLTGAHSRQKVSTYTHCLCCCWACLFTGSSNDATTPQYF